MGGTTSVSVQSPFLEKTGGTALLIIDPQNDFHPGGALAVEGANEDAERVAKLIRDNKAKLSQITVTLDSHQRMHIAHASFWKNKKGEHPSPFTLISSKDVEAGIWQPTVNTKKMQAYVKTYCTTLERNNRFKLCIWPDHCLIGTSGHNVKDVINKELQEWMITVNDEVNYVMKGMNSLTEMYSALAADVAIKEDPLTGLNRDLLKQLFKADRILICGQALSHCVNFTVRDILYHWPKGRPKSDLWLLEDCTSPVPGFTEDAKDFVKFAKKEGCTLVKAADAFKK